MSWFPDGFLMKVRIPFTCSRFPDSFVTNMQISVATSWFSFLQTCEWRSQFIDFLYVSREMKIARNMWNKCEIPAKHMRTDNATTQFSSYCFQYIFHIFGNLDIWSYQYRSDISRWAWGVARTGYSIPGRDEMGAGGVRKFFSARRHPVCVCGHRYCFCRWTCFSLLGLRTEISARFRRELLRIAPAAAAHPFGFD